MEKMKEFDKSLHGRNSQQLKRFRIYRRNSNHGHFHDKSRFIVIVFVSYKQRSHYTFYLSHNHNIALNSDKLEKYFSQIWFIFWGVSFSIKWKRESCQILWKKNAQFFQNRAKFFYCLRKLSNLSMKKVRYSPLFSVFFLKFLFCVFEQLKVIIEMTLWIDRLIGPQY